jgi:type 1 glutamine amidotransferase
MTDETYTTNEPENSTVLLRVDHPHSMRALAWTRQVDAARVFCLQSGHDNSSWAHPGFRHTLERGIAWCAGRI